MTPQVPGKALAADGLPSLIGMDRGGLQAVLVDLGEVPSKAAMRARQLFHWIYHQGAVSFDQMTTLSRPLRAGLAQRYSVARPEVVVKQRSGDGTHKWLLRFFDGQEVECVFIPERGRGALCVSTQVGCTLTCRFCHTGTMPLVRNLTCGEILAQVMVARDELGEWPSPCGDRLFTNIVVMGMGEPLFNYDGIAAAMKLAMDGDGIGLSRRKITLSTSGVVPRIVQWGEELGTGLAISLHAVRDDLRDELVPINRKWNIGQLIDACRSYPARGRPITFEYVMLAGVNDSDVEAGELVNLLHGLDAKVNLIPFNPWPDAPFACSSNNRMHAFARILEAAGYASPIRVPRGRDIFAACGQLKTASERLRKRAAAPSVEALVT